jgi:hypothetical protein
MTMVEATDTAPRSVRRVAAGFVAAIAAGSVALLALTPQLVSGNRPAARYYESPMMMPMVALAIMAVCAAIQAGRILRGASLAGDDIEEPAAHWRLVLVAMGAYAAYLVVVPLVGYVAGTLCFVVATGILTGLGWRTSAVVAIAVTAILFGLFVRALQVWFPAPAMLGGF